VAVAVRTWLTLFRSVLPEVGRAVASRERTKDEDDRQHPPGEAPGSARVAVGRCVELLANSLLPS
jgi:hypothetical protein